MPTHVRSHAKVNLGLGIGAPRADGFHSLATVYQTLELHDWVRVHAERGPETSIRLVSNDPRVPLDERNTAWKMVDLALKELGITAQVRIFIEKHLPVQGGLGAGSANAVAALVGLEAELQGTGIRDQGSEPGSQNRDLGHPGNAGPFTAPAVADPAPDDNAFGGTSWAEKRLEIAARVGSDVPLFLIGGTVLGLDRGQEVIPLPDIEPLWCVVAAPEVGVSTPQAFRDWDQLCAAEGLTPEASTDKLNRLSRAYARAFEPGQRAGSSGVPTSGGDLAGPEESALVRTGITSWIENDFERVVFRQHPSLAEIKRLLAGTGIPEAALYASLSGSGSALFGLYLTRKDAESACGRLESAGVRFFLTRTLPREAYRREMVRSG